MGAWRAGVRDPEVYKRVYAGLSKETLGDISKNMVATDKWAESKFKTLTFNTSLRKKIYGAAVIGAAVSSIKSIATYRDPRVPVYDEADYGGTGATGSLALSMYYNQR